MSEPVALYEKVKRHITDAIVAGEYTPGSKIPSKKALVETLSVSRLTVNRTLRELSRAKYACDVVKLDRNLADNDVAQLLELENDVPVLHVV